ncbi:MAG: spermidine/putrescine-binding protein [Verrucomicrobiales bacterium]|jgi:spermidine/putrescine-binding protein
MRITIVSRFIGAGLNPALFILACVLVLLTLNSCRDDAEPKTLTILGWDEYIPAETLERFTKTTGIEFDYQAFANMDDAVGRVTSEPDRYDVILTDMNIAGQLRQRQLLGDLDHRQLSNLGNLGQTYTDILSDPDYSFSAPYLMGNTVLIYNTKLVENPEPSWSLLWNRDAIGDGQVWMLREPQEVLSVALLALGHDMNTTEPAEFEAARDLLFKQLDSVEVVYGSELEIADALVEGRCAAAMLYNSNASLAMEENEDLKTVLPREGVALFNDVFLVSRESLQRAAAHAFIDFMLSAEAAVECAEYNWCATPNERAAESLDPELLADEIAFPPAELLAKCAFRDSRKSDRMRLIGVNFKAIMDRYREKPAVAATPTAEAEADQ